MKTYKIIFSPTGGTEKAANAITSNWTDTETIDLSVNNKDYSIALEEDALALKKACSVVKENEIFI